MDAPVGIMGLSDFEEMITPDFRLGHNDNPGFGVPKYQAIDGNEAP